MLPLVILFYRFGHLAILIFIVVCLAQTIQVYDTEYLNLWAICVHVAAMSLTVLATQWILINLMQKTDQIYSCITAMMTRTWV